MVHKLSFLHFYIFPLNCDSTCCVHIVCTFQSPTNVQHKMNNHEKDELYLRDKWPH